MPSFLPDANTFERYGTTISAIERVGIIKAGYSLPITDSLALGAEAFSSIQNAIMTDIYGSTGDDDLWVAPSFFGGIVSSGIRFSENIASGLSFGFYRHSEPAEDLDGLYCYSGEGVSLQFRKLFIDINSEYRSKPYYLVPDERYSEILISISIGIDGLLR